MLPKTKRVKRALFPKVFGSGRTAHSVFLTMRVAAPPQAVPVRKELGQTTSFAASRFSFVVSKAVAKKAVDRNLLRRRGYSIVPKLYNSLPTGLVIVFFFKKGSDKLSYSALSEEIAGILGKAGLLRK